MHSVWYQDLTAAGLKSPLPILLTTLALLYDAQRLVPRSHRCRAEVLTPTSIRTKWNDFRLHMTIFEPPHGVVEYKATSTDFEGASWHLSKHINVEQYECQFRLENKRIAHSHKSYHGLHSVQHQGRHQQWLSGPSDLLPSEPASMHYYVCQTTQFM